MTGNPAPLLATTLSISRIVGILTANTLADSSPTVFLTKPMTTSKANSLRAYTAGPLLAFHWRYGGAVGKDLCFTVNGLPLPKPMLGVILEQGREYLLFGQAPIEAAPQTESVNCEIRNGQTTVAQYRQKQLPALAELDTDHCSQLALSRLWQALLHHAPRSFPRLTEAELRDLLQAVAYRRCLVTSLADGQHYLHLRWSSTQPPAVEHISLHNLSSAGQSTQIRIIALRDGNGVHVVIPRAVHWFSNAVFFLLTLADETRIPIAFDLAKLAVSTHPIAVLLQQNSTAPESLISVFGERLARLQTKQQTHAPKLLGRITGLHGDELRGWVKNSSRPFVPVSVDVLIDNEHFTTVGADQECGGLSATTDFGNHGYSCKLPEALLAGGRNHRLDLYVAGSRLPVPGSPWIFGPDQFDGGLRVTEDGCLHGWVRERIPAASALDLRVYLDEQPLGFAVASPDHPAKFPGSVPADSASFVFALPESAFDAKLHRLRVAVRRIDGEYPVPSECSVQADYRLSLAAFTLRQVTAQITDTAYPRRQFRVSIFINDSEVRRVSIDGSATTGTHLDVLLPELKSSRADRKLSLRVTNTDCELASETLSPVTVPAVIKALTAIAEQLRNSSTGNSETSATTVGRVEQASENWVRTQVIANAIRSLRATATLAGPLSIDLDSNAPPAAVAAKDPTIDVIIPVYRGLQETLACIDSVTAARCAERFELIVINDCSPEPALTTALRRLAQQGRCTYLENTENRGFVASVNRGMRLHPERDVILLNSDTLVPSGWLDRLRTAADGATGIATVTPFSNNATICSYPRFCAENPLPDGIDLAELDALFASSNAGLTVDIPTAVGFCMYIKRSALNEVGYFDEQQWGKGYAEENDFCLRASTLGWRHVIACDLFVQHHGAVSFADTQSQLLTTNLALLHQRYPEYHALVEDFIQQDPLAGARRSVSKAILKRTLRKPFLFISHSLGGGTEKAARELAERLESEGKSVLFLHSTPACIDKVTLSATAQALTLEYAGDGILTILADDLRELEVCHIHYHHTLDYHREILQLPERLAVAYDFTTHDYLPVCPRINLIDCNHQYCGPKQHQLQYCNLCIAQAGVDPGARRSFAELGNTVGAWRAKHAEFLRNARKVFAPSQDVADRYRQHFQLENVHLKPHPGPTEPAMVDWQPQRRRIINVAIIGAIGQHKGYALLVRCAIHAHTNNLPLHFVVIGYTQDDDQLRQIPGVTITGEYTPAELPTILKRHDCRIALILSQWPETYLYTLSEAWQLGLYPIALNIGAASERIKAGGVGDLLPPDADADTVIAALLKSELKAAVRKNISVYHPYPSLLGDYYGLVPVESPIAKEFGL